MWRAELRPNAAAGAVLRMYYRLSALRNGTDDAESLSIDVLTVVFPSQVVA